MAGKTFPGIGDDPPLDPADAADSADSGGEYYSGPTVVDDAKVEMGLQKLRSLDAPPGPLTGITKAVVDALETEPTRTRVEGTPIIPEITVDSGRETAVGRSVVGPAGGQQTTTTQPFDDKHLRGTMFGHGVHLPEIELPARPAATQPVSRALAVIDRGAPTHNAVAVFHQPPPPRYTNGEPPPASSASLRSSRFQNTPYDVPVPEVSRGKKMATRIATVVVGIAAFVGAAMIWIRTNGEDDPVVRPAPVVRLPPVQAARPIPPPVAPPPPPPAATAPAAPAEAAAAPPAKESARPAAAHAAADDKDSPAAAPVARRSHAEHHRAAKSAEGQGAAGETKPDKPEKPARAAKRGSEEDPDATMAPTIE